MTETFFGKNNIDMFCVMFKQEMDKHKLLTLSWKNYCLYGRVLKPNQEKQ